MELSKQCEEIVEDITSLFDQFEMPLEERKLLSIPFVYVYFKGMKHQKQNSAEPIKTLCEQVLYGLERERVSKKYSL